VTPSQPKDAPELRLEKPAKRQAEPARPFAPEGWGYDWQGNLVDLRGLRPGEDGVPAVYAVTAIKREE
jgi:hypothetical protein